MRMLSDTVPSGASPLLSARGLTVTYGSGQQSVPTLNKLSFDLAPGEIVGLLGESGCGKSTLALSILGLLPDKSRVEGSIMFHDQDLLQLEESAWQRIRGARISAIFQEPGLALSPVMRVGDQILEVIRAHRPGSRRALKEECHTILNEVRLPDVDRVYKAYPHQLSGGQLHRIAIAQALACRPDLVVADEPTRSLDVTVQTEILDLLRSISRKVGSSLIFITHNPALLVGFADRVIVMYGGRIVEDGNVTQVFQRPFHPYTKGLLQLIPRGLREGLSNNGRLLAVPGSLTDADRMTRGCVFESRCSARTNVCRSESPIETMPEPGRRVSCFNYGN